MRYISRTAVLFSIILFTLHTSNAASKNGGQITGSILNQSGSPLRDAIIRIFRDVQEDELITIVRSDSRGFYKSLHLAPGIYHLRVSRQGYLPKNAGKFEVGSGHNISMDIILNELFDRISNDDDPRNWGIGAVMRSTSDRRLIFRNTPKDIESDNSRNAAISTVPFNRSGAMSIASNTSLNRENFLTGPQSNQSGITSNFAFTEPLSPHGRMIFSGQMDFGNSSFWRIRDTFNYRQDKDHDYRVSLGFGQMNANYPGSGSIPAQLTPQNPDFQESGADTFSFGVEGRTRLLNLLAINYAFEYSRLHYGTDRGLFHPSFQILLTPSEKWSFRTSISSRRLSDTNAIVLSDGETLNLSEPAMINMIGNHIRMSQVRHSEVAAQRTIIAGTSVELAAYQDRTMGAGIPIMLTTNTPLEQQSSVIEIDQQCPVQRGMRFTVNRKLADYLDSSIAYIYGGATSISAGNERLASSQLIENLPRYLRRHYQHSITGRLNATIPITRTMVLATMRWNSGNPLTPLDWFSDRMDIGTKSTSFQIRQTIPLPEFFGTSGKWEVLVELRNMLNQGRETLSASNGDIILNRYPRSLRCGINLNF
jgi:hypothetical protein